MRAQPLDSRVANLEGSFGQMNQRVGAFEGAVASVRSDVQSLRSDMNAEFTALRSDMNARFNAMDQRFNWVIGLVAGSWFTTVGMLVTAMIAVIPHLK